MKLNIKNARRLESTIDDQIDRIRYKADSATGTYTDSKQASDSTAENLNTLLTQFDNLVVVKFYIREEIGKFNKEQGIDTITASIALSETKLSLLTTAAGMRDPSPRNTYGKDTVVFGPGLNEESRESFYAETLKLKRHIQRLKDKCQGINSTGTIEFPTETESFLKKSGLID